MTTWTCWILLQSGTLPCRWCCLSIHHQTKVLILPIPSGPHQQIMTLFQFQLAAVPLPTKLVRRRGQVIAMDRWLCWFNHVAYWIHENLDTIRQSRYLLCTILMRLDTTSTGAHLVTYLYCAPCFDCQVSSSEYRYQAVGVACPCHCLQPSVSDLS
jgi:hypothetical protein